jgi:hypothetical protein
MRTKFYNPISPLTWDGDFALYSGQGNKFSGGSCAKFDLAILVKQEIDRGDYLNLTPL